VCAFVCVCILFVKTQLQVYLLRPTTVNNYCCFCAVRLVRLSVAAFRTKGLFSWLDFVWKCERVVTTQSRGEEKHG